MASRLIGAIVGTFKVGTGVKVGQPTFQPDKPKLILKGGAFQTRVLGDLQSIPVGKGKLTLAAKPIVVSHMYSLTVVSTPRLTLKGGAYVTKEPDKQRPGTARITLKAKHFVLNQSASIRVGKAKMILKAKPIAKVGKAGLVPLVPVDIAAMPSPAYGKLLVPTTPYTELLVPTTVKIV